MGRGWTGASSLPLWYPHYDSWKSFGDFQAFGGWTSPSIKQYIGNANSCGIGVDYNWCVWCGWVCVVCVVCVCVRVCVCVPPLWILLSSSRRHTTYVALQRAPAHLRCVAGILGAWMLWQSFTTPRCGSAANKKRQSSSPPVRTCERRHEVEDCEPAWLTLGHSHAK